MTKAHFDVFIFIVCVTKFTIGEHEQFTMEMTHKHNKCLQILAQIQSTRNRGAEGTSLSTAKATPTTRDRGTGDWNQRHYDRFTLSKTQIS